MKHWTFRLSNGKVSFQLSLRWLLIMLMCFLVVGTLFVLSLSIGSNWIPIVDVFLELTGYIDQYSYVVETLRLPRVLLAMLVGASLGIAGLILQNLVRNPLASPDIIGITSGASLGAVLFIIFGTGIVSMKFLPLAAIVGGICAAILIYIISWNNGVTPIRLVLIGIGISAILKASITFFLVLSETATTTKAYIWLTGSLYGANMSDVLAMSLWLLIPLPVLLIWGRSLNVAELGDDISTSMGIHVQRQRLLFLMCSVVFAGTAAAFAGGIEFVGLMAPHIARRLVGKSFIGLVPVTALVGAFIVMLADLIARSLFLPLDIPAGVFTAAIGAPFFIYLLFQNRHR
ncbi:FecCD family ABC transporter permease [Lysinibacillus xylanilyticus]|uniref:FecCD family ABC transporter permease n=1 Tax=Lysinibacillus xylanilyticus TaxID=582475 RepID=A0ABV3VTH9_9BACI